MGGKRGRLIPNELRKEALSLIIEAVDAEARLHKACEALEISVSTFRRWKEGAIEDKRKGAIKKIPRKLTAKEEAKIIEVSCNKEYRDKNVYELHANLLDKGIYIASISSFYRVLRKNKMINHRQNTKPGVHAGNPPERKATGSNQVWCWDITWLPTNVRGIFYYAYVIIDIWDRSIVKWAIHDREDTTLAKELFKQALGENDYPNVFIHSDNGSPMKGVALLALFYKLGIVNSYSRPRVSNDNPFIESWFKTVKYSIKYPGNFTAINLAREWFAMFVDEYNTKHSHSGLHFITPKQLRTGKYTKIVKQRNKVMTDAKKANPHRWSCPVKQLPEKHVVYLNPTADTRIKLKKESKLKKVS